MTRIVDAILVLFLRTFALILLLITVFVLYVMEVWNAEGK